jgi:thiol-disulfide isomerase/thioredoxin
MSLSRLAPFLLALPLLAQAAPGTSAAKVAALAKEGHWVPESWASHEALLGKPAPGLALSGWLNGEVKPADMKGKIVVVDFWATWCPPCRAAVPHNNELQAKYGAKGVIVLGVCGSGRGEEKMEAVAKDLKLAYPTAHPTRATTEAWHVEYWPTYGIVDRKGILRALGVTPDAVEGIVEALLAE